MKQEHQGPIAALVKLIEEAGRSTRPTWIASEIAQEALSSPHWTLILIAQHQETVSLHQDAVSSKEVQKEPGKKTDPSYDTNLSPNLPALLDIPTAASFLSISKASVYRLLSGGILVGRKLGRKTLIERDALLKYIASLPPMTPTGLPLNRPR